MKTRSRVLELLRGGQKTVDQLARSLGVTANAVRMHLDSLVREGAVYRVGVQRRGLAGKPAALYDVTADTEAARSKAYAPVLSALIGTLAERLSEAELESLLRVIGRRLAGEPANEAGSLHERALNVSALLNELGGVTTVEASGAVVVVRGSTCPLAVAVRTNPRTCVAIEALVAKVSGARAHQQCTHQPRPACRFALQDV